MGRYEAIIFDKDGCLFDFQATWGVWAGRVLRGLAGDDADLLDRLAAAVDYDLDRQTVKPDSIVVAGTPLEIATALAAVLDVHPASMLARLNSEAEKAPQVIVPGVPDMLHRLKAAGLKLAVMTNDSEKPARAHLDAANISQYFDLIVGSDSGRGAKPDPAPLVSILQDLDVQPDRAVMVGDSLHDLHAGRAAGMSAVGVLTGVALHATLAPDADTVLTSAADLAGWITP